MAGFVQKIDYVSYHVVLVSSSRMKDYNKYIIQEIFSNAYNIREAPFSLLPATNRYYSRFMM